MVKKPPYEELERRVQELEKEVVERRQLEGTLKESGEGYRDFFNLNPDPVVIVQDKVVKLANSAYTKLFGVNQEDVDNGFSLFDHLQEEDKDGVDQRYKERLSGKKLQDFHQVEIRSKNGKNIPCEAYSSLIQYDGRPALLAVIRDISKRKEADEKLRMSETRYRTLFEAAGDGIFLLKVFNQDLNFADFNPFVLEMFRCTRDEFLGKPPLDFSPPIQPDGTPSNKMAFERIQPTLEGRPQFFEWQHRRPDGSFFDSETSLTRLSLNGEIYIQAIIRDITDRKLAEEELRKHRDHLKDLVVERTKNIQKVNEELRESEEKYKTLFVNAGDALFIMEVDAERRSWFHECNQRTLSLFGCESDYIIGKSTAVFSPETQADGRSSMEKAIEITRLVMEGQPQDFQWFCQRYDNKEPLWVEVNLTRLTLGGKPNYMQAVLRDITERKKAEELVHNLSRQLLTAQESERQIISYELHDSVAQELSSSKIICEMLLKYKSLTPGARKQISEISGNLLKTIRGVRDLSYNLRPPGLEELGLPHVMYQFCKDFSEKTGVRVDFQSAGMDNLNLDHDTMINLYRVLQEGLNNVKKHADARNVQIRLVSSFPNIILRIDDDGKGFNLKEHLAKASSEKRMGLSSMAHRVDLLLGRIDIESLPGKGTKVLIEIPHKDENIGA